MANETKSTVDKTNTFDLLEIRMGRVTTIELEPTAPKPAYRMTIDFGKFGIRTSVGRFTKHEAEELKGRIVVGILNFEPRVIGSTTSEVLILGVQFPKADSGEATPVTPINSDAKIGGKLF